jgi:enoyl-[acyl-carrier protein] reductase I
MTCCDGNSSQWLAGKKGLVVGVANDKSIAWGCAKAFSAMGAELAMTYQNEKTKTYTEPLTQQINTGLFLPCDVQAAGSLEAVFEAIQKKWGKLDFLLHAIAFAPMNDLHGRVTDCSRDGFLQAMDISCHSFIRMAKLAEPLMTDGGSLLTLTYNGSQQVVHDYNCMGPVKAALESTMRYLAAELGPKNIRVNAVSPGPISTRAGSGIKDFNALLDEKEKASPLRHLSTQEDIGWTTAFLASDKARSTTGTVAYVDCGVSVLG